MPSKIRKDTDATTEPYRDDCPFCTKNATTRTREGAWKRQSHYLRLAEDEGIDALEAHLQRYLVRWHAEDTELAREAIQSTLAWVWGQVRTYSDMVDGDTGAPLSWAEGRRQTIQIMLAAGDAQAASAEGGHDAE